MQRVFIIERYDSNNIMNIPNIMNMQTIKNHNTIIFRARDYQQPIKEHIQLITGY